MDYQERSSELEKDADRMEERSDELEGEIEDAGQEWKSKQTDQSVPGAQPTEAAGTDEEGAQAADEDDSEADSAEADGEDDPDSR